MSEPARDISPVEDSDVQLPWDLDAHDVSAALPAMQDEPVEVETVPLAPVAVEKSSTSGGWTIPLLCLGVGLIALCLLIPAADDNRKLVYERERLRLDQEQIEKQIETNEKFLKLVADDPTLAERLAQRQMKMVREGSAILDLHSPGMLEMSPFELVTLPPPPELPPYQPVGGRIAALCRNPRSKLYLMGCGFLLSAVGLVLGASRSRS